MISLQFYLYLYLFCFFVFSCFSLCVASASQPSEKQPEGRKHCIKMNPLLQMTLANIGAVVIQSCLWTWFPAATGAPQVSLPGTPLVAPWQKWTIMVLRTRSTDTTLPLLLKTRHFWCTQGAKNCFVRIWTTKLG